MQAYRVKTTWQQDGTLTLSNLPLRAGESVAVIILVQPPVAVDRQQYLLRGVPGWYIDPTEPVAQADWDAAQCSSSTRILGVVGSWQSAPS